MKREYQSFGLAADGSVIHAGVSSHSKMTHRVAKSIQRKWESWRKQYLEQNPGDYPLRFTNATVALLVHPVGKPEMQMRFDV